MHGLAEAGESVKMIDAAWAYRFNSFKNERNMDIWKMEVSEIFWHDLVIFFSGKYGILILVAFEIILMNWMHGLAEAAGSVKMTEAAWAYRFKSLKMEYG